MSDSIRHSRPHAIGRSAVVALLGIAAVAATACARQPVAQGTPFAAPVAAATNTNAVPVAVNCGPGQQALIRPSLVNGQPISQVDCVATGATTTAYPVVPAGFAPTSVAYAPVQPVAAAGDVETVRIVERPVYRQAARPASYRTAEYAPERRSIRRDRSWQKSAVIIGSSAGIAAGIGGAAGGKKGALIGAALGGGGAAIWDQITRR
jgi:hypothetical protein